MLEEKHFQDCYLRNHIGKNRHLKEKLEAERRARESKSRFMRALKSTDNLSSQGSSGIEMVMRQVNQDKCNYSRLKSYELQDIEWVQVFIKRANQAQQSELLNIQ